jgi:hypothetical protein
MIEMGGELEAAEEADDAEGAEDADGEVEGAEGDDGDEDDDGVEDGPAVGDELLEGVRAHDGEQLDAEDGGEGHVEVVQDDFERGGGAVLCKEAVDLLLRLDHGRAEILRAGACLSSETARSLSATERR